MCFIDRTSVPCGVVCVLVSQFSLVFVAVCGVWVRPAASEGNAIETRQAIAA